MNEPIADTSAANAGAAIDTAPEGTATPTEPAQIQADTQAPASIGENTAPPETVPPEPQVTDTQAFARRLKEKTAETEKALTDKYDAIIAKLGGSTPDGRPIQTLDDLQKALEYQEMQAEAAEQNVPVELYSRLTQAEKDAKETKEMLSEYQRKDATAKEAETLAADPKWGEFFKANEADIRAVADKAKCDLGTAKLIVYDRVGPAKVNEAAIANKAIQDYLAGKIKDYKPVEGSGATPVQVPSAPKTFKDAREGSLAFLHAQHQQT